MNTTLKYVLLGLLCIGLGVLAGHWLWPPDMEIVVHTRIDSVLTKELQFRADSLHAVLVTEHSRLLNMEARTKRAIGAARYYEALADSFLAELGKHDSSGSFSIVAAIDTTLHAQDTINVLVDSTKHQFVQDRKLRILNTYHFPPENFFSLWATVDPSMTYFAVKDTHQVIQQPSTISWYWYTVPALVATILTLLLVRR